MGQWKLVFEDHFDKEKIDRGVWDYELGFIRNKEPQYYTDRPDNSYVENSDLVIVTRRENYKGAFYTSASLNTFGNKAFLYGKIEMRAKLPRGKGIWPAFWMMGESFPAHGWPQCGEIDIMETVGHVAKETGDLIYTTAHWLSKASGEHSQDGVTRQMPLYSLSDKYHTYAVDWDADRIIWLFDEQKIFKMDIPLDSMNAFHQPHSILINTALCAFEPSCTPDETTLFPQEYRIDYIRVYQKI